MKNEDDEKEVLGKSMDEFSSLPEGTTQIEKLFFFTLIGMAKWAVAHPSTSKYQFISPEEIKANQNLKDVFMQWWHTEHPGMKPEQEKTFQQSIKDGLFPGGVIEHTADGHHPIGFSWGSESYVSDFYLCLTYAMIQYADRQGNDVTNKFAPLYIAREVQRLNRVAPSVEIVDAMNHLLNEPEPNKTSPYSLVSAEVN